MSKKEFIPQELPINIHLDIKIYELLSKASGRLGELKGFAKTIPNQDILINSLLLQEAKDSNAIENIITTHDELFLAQIDESKITKNAKEVQNYELALKLGIRLIKKENLLRNKHILEIQKRLERNYAGFRTQSGTMLKNPATGEIKHIPPQHKDDILRLMNNLESYINEDLDNFDPLIKLAIIHYQFETIHPFYDGNGRVGRILNILYLVFKERLDTPILYLSAYIIKHKDKYYHLLEQVSKNAAWNEWIVYILQGIEKTSIATIQRIKDIDKAMKDAAEVLQNNADKIYSKDLIEALFFYPYTKIEFLEKKLKISRQSASKYLKTCEKLTLLECIKIGRNKYFINVRLFKILSNPLI
ncbi:Fic family protein [Helicobacter sp. MIT 05-5294]|uniref:Fic family protein n=1 Tax=Helicobacter sp. MIT 05-5294 TaxID=1548150 RepID=UPI00051FB4A1|nr:Fic family protein [Helicobacter sp. MIT 05-5294]TLD86177.1 Fic family protein [Helicobacter sp. MIT 05-5294]